VHSASLSFLNLKPKYMPNWCLNRLTVSGDKHEINKFKELTLVKPEKSSELNFTMEVLYPTPTELLEQTSPAMWRGDELDVEGKLEFEKKIEELKQKYGHTDWYDWRVKNWGTKWGIYSSSLKISKLDNNVGKLKYNFQSAWDPATLIIEAMSKQFPKLTFTLKYYERGRGFKGIYKVKNLVVLENTQLEYSGKRGG
jgi:hypothetical protein